MIILEKIKPENNKTSFLIFANEQNSRVVVPVPKSLGDLISAYLRIISNESENTVERGNDELSD